MKGQPKPKRGRKDPSPYPKGWNRNRVEAVIKHYDNQTDDQAIAEAEAAYRDEKTAIMQVPLELVPEIEKLIAKRAG